MKSMQDFCPEILLGNIWHNYKLCRSKSAEIDLKFRLFSEFKDDLTSYYNYTNNSSYSALDLVQMLIVPYNDIENELFVYRSIFARSGLDVSELCDVLGEKTFTSLWDMKIYDTFDCIFIDTSNETNFIHSLYYFIFD